MKEYDLKKNPVSLDGTLAGYKPKYILLNRDSYTVKVVEGEEELNYKIKGRAISKIGLSQLIQLSYIIPPYTIYDDVFTVNIGDTITLEIINGVVDVNYNHNYPFTHDKRLVTNYNQDDVLESLYVASRKQSKSDVANYLFHTAGKDSNTILAAYLEAGKAQELTLVSGASGGDTDESQISKGIAKKFGLNHLVLPIQEELGISDLDFIKSQLKNHVFPNVDSIMIPLCMYTRSNNIFDKSNCIFGDGNDGYFISLPSSLQKNISWFTHCLSNFKKYDIKFSSASKIYNIFRSNMEWSGVYGLTYNDSLQVLGGSVNAYNFVCEDEKSRNQLNSWENSSDGYSTRAISQRMMQKLSLFCIANNSNLVLPFADDGFAKAWGFLGDDQVSNTKERLNKTILRDIVLKKIGVDTTAIGKKGWSFDYVEFVKKHKSMIMVEIKRCSTWDEGVTMWLDQMYSINESRFTSVKQARRAIYLIFVVSLWLNARSDQ